MSEPFLAEVKMFGFNFAPRGWAQCNGQILPINQNQSLYSLLGTTFGGDGRTTFALPELRGRVPIHIGTGHPWGQRSGEENHVLTSTETPQHTHVLSGTSANVNSRSPSGTLYGRADESTYHAPASPVAMRAGVISNAGGGQGHNNMQPFLTINYCIALQGLFPSRS